MAARSVVIASVAAPVVRRVIPGRALPEGVTPESEGSILAWLKSHVGKVAANAEAYAGKMEGGGFDCLYNLEFGHNDLVALGIPEGHARTIATNAVYISRLLGSITFDGNLRAGRDTLHI